MLKHKIIPSYLPIFTGFYNTQFEADTDRCIEDNKNYEDYKFDYQKYQNEVSIECCKILQKELNTILGFKSGLQIIYEDLVQPRFYNYTNDSINVKYKLTDEIIKAINVYLIENKENFEQYLIDNYASYSGFASFYNTDVYTWLNTYLSDKDKLKHCFGSILQFILINEGYSIDELANEIQESVFLDAELIEQD